MGNRPALILLLVCALGALAPLNARAADAPKANAPAATTATASAPDERPLWALLRAQRYRDLFAEIERLRAMHPGWNPPQQLLDLATEGALGQRVKNALAADDAAGLAKLAAENPAVFGCRRIDWAWELGAAYKRLGRGAEAISLAENLIANCDEDKQRLATLYKARNWMPAPAWGSLVEAELDRPRTPGVDAEYQRLRFGVRLERFTTAQSQGAADAPALFEAIAADVEAFKDSGGALAGAWGYFNRPDLANAKRWFESALAWNREAYDARYGLALIAMRENRIEEAEGQLRALPESYARRADLARDVALAGARSAFEAKKYHEALAWLEKAKTYGPLPRSGQMQQGWSLLNSGDALAAAALFERLYGEQPDEESAQGLVLSYRRAGKNPELLRPLAQGGPLAAMIAENEVGEKISRKQFLAARRADPGVAETLGGAGVPRIGLIGIVREKSGDAGTSKLRLVAAPSIEAANRIGERAELRVRVDRISLDSGSLAPNQVVGSAAGGTYAINPVTRVEGEMPRLFLRVEGDAVWEANLGMTPSGGPLSSRAFGGIQRRAFTSWGQYDLAVFAEPLAESILSYTGLRDPYTGDTSWGRVLRYGVDARALWLGSTGWTRGLHLRYEQIQGTGVADNERYVVDGGVGRNLGLDGFDYAVLGLEVGAQGYQRNLSQFTLGHGGYYSPQKFVRAGIAFDFLTAERQRWIIGGRLSAGRALREQEDTPVFPLTGVGNVPGARDYGNDTALEFSAVWSVAAHWQVGALFLRSTAPQFDNTIGGVLVRFLFEPRRSTVSTDLPLQSFNDVKR